MTALEAVQGVLDLMAMSSRTRDEWEPDTIVPHTNGYSMWFVGCEQFAPEGVLMFSTELTAEQILERIEARRRAEFSHRQITHGRHCPCSACAAEDWTRPDLAPCGMHGYKCPRVYAPLRAEDSQARPE